MDDSITTEIVEANTPSDRYAAYHRSLRTQQNERYQVKLLASRFSVDSVRASHVGRKRPEPDSPLSDAQNLSNDIQLTGALIDEHSDARQSSRDASDDDVDDLFTDDGVSSRSSVSDDSDDELSCDRIQSERECFLNLLVDFIRDANLNKTAASSLLSLLKSGKSCDDIPSTLTQLLTELNVSFHYETFIYCSGCLSLLIKFQDRCSQCLTSDRKPNSELIVFSATDELKRVVRSNLKLIQWYSLPENQLVSDIVQGSLYRQRPSNLPVLSIMLSTDGKPMINSKATRTSVWPVMGFLVEIPPFIRERLENLMLFGLWHSPITPPTDLLLTKIVHTIKTMTMIGIDFPIGQKSLHFDVRVQLMSGDLPARSKCNKLNSHNGYFACSRCLIEGQRCLAPCKRHTLYRWIDFCQNQYEPRTQEHMNQCAKQVSRNPRDSYGVLGSSPLSLILSIPIQSTLDYFHLALEIHLRTLMEEWCRMIKGHPGALDLINGFLLQTTYPHSFNRTPKDFSNYGKWKASELRTFLIYVSLPALVRLRLSMPNCFPEIYLYHFSLYFIYVRTLRHFADRREIFDMPSFIREYLKLFPSLYGTCKELFSAHALFHLWEQVEKHGGLAYHSLFSTESCLSHIGKLSHGSVGLGQQIAYWWCLHRQFRSKQKVHHPSSLTNVELVLDSFLDPSILNNYRQEFDLAYNQSFGEFPSQSMKIYSRCVHGLLLYHSLSYSRRKRSTSFNVYFEAEGQHGKSVHGFGQTLFFFYAQNRPFCLLRRFLVSTKCFSSLLRSSNETPKWDTYLDKYYSIICPSMSTVVIYPCSFIVSKCLIFPYDEKYSVCTPIELELEHD